MDFIKGFMGFTKGEEDTKLNLISVKGTPPPKVSLSLCSKVTGPVISFRRRCGMFLLLASPMSPGGLGTFVMAMIVDYGRAISSYSDTRGFHSVPFNGVKLLFKNQERDPDHPSYKREKICVKLLQAGPQVSLAICGSSDWGYLLRDLLFDELDPNNRGVSTAFQIKKKLYKCMKNIKSDHMPDPPSSAAIVTFFEYPSRGPAVPFIYVCDSDDSSVNFHGDYACDGVAFEDVKADLDLNYQSTYRSMTVPQALGKGQVFVRLAAGRAEADRLRRQYVDDAYVGGDAHSLTKKPGNAVRDTVFKSLGQIRDLYV